MSKHGHSSSQTYRECCINNELRRSTSSTPPPEWWPSQWSVNLPWLESITLSIGAREVVRARERLHLLLRSNSKLAHLPPGRKVNCLGLRRLDVWGGFAWGRETRQEGGGGETSRRFRQPANTRANVFGENNDSPSPEVIKGRGSYGRETLHVRNVCRSNAYFSRKELAFIFSFIFSFWLFFFFFLSGRVGFCLR